MNEAHKKLGIKVGKRKNVLRVIMDEQNLEE